MTTLPLELQDSIMLEAGSRYKPTDVGAIMAAGYIAGATKYALKYHTLQQENERLRKALEEAKELIEGLKTLYYSKMPKEQTLAVDKCIIKCNAALTAQPEAENQKNHKA